MSYLLDALRKAEHERSAQRTPQLAESWRDGAGQRGARLPSWGAALLIAVVVINLAVIGWVLWADAGDGAAAPATVSSAATGQSRLKPLRLDSGLSSPSQEVNPAPSTSNRQRKQADSRQPHTAVQPRTQPQIEQGQPIKPPPAPSGPAPYYNELSSAQQARLPAFTVNGLLYSTIPGRSFVILNGRRYHEGQRTREGPAIIQIDRDGVALNADGLRYRLPAPQ